MSTRHDEMEKNSGQCKNEPDKNWKKSWVVCVDIDGDAVREHFVKALDVLDPTKTIGRSKEMHSIFVFDFSQNICVMSLNRTTSRHRTMGDRTTETIGRIKEMHSLNNYKNLSCMHRHRWGCGTRAFRREHRAPCSRLPLLSTQRGLRCMRLRRETAWDKKKKWNVNFFLTVSRLTRIVVCGILLGCCVSGAGKRGLIKIIWWCTHLER